MFYHIVSSTCLKIASTENISIRSNGPVEVRSPGYPDSFPGGFDISWVILAEEDQKIRVSFNDPTTEVDDSWNVGDGDVVGLSTILSWDKRRRQLPDLLSTGSAIWVLQTPLVRVVLLLSIFSISFFTDFIKFP